MGQIKGIKYGYNDINIVPEKITDLKSRSEVNLYDGNGMLPIFAAPMDTVVDDSTFYEFRDNNIYSVIPRTCKLSRRCELMQLYAYDHEVFVSVSLREAKFIFLENPINNNLTSDELFYSNQVRGFLSIDGENASLKICIDLANGHMSDLLNTIKLIKDKYKSKVTIMSGNIANPQTYIEYDKVGCDYVRVSIGSGEGCSTSTNTGVHYPIFSLLEETYKIKQDIEGKCKIIADGGIKGFGDIQKALIYSDYVMIGGVFSRLVESAGDKYYGKSYWNIRGRRIFRPLKTLFTYGRKANTINVKKLKNGTQEYYKIFKGMSTPEAQMAIRKAENNETNLPLKPTEGFVKKMKVDLVLDEWVRSEKAYLASMMSYINAKSLKGCKDALWIVKQSKNHN